MNKLSFLEEIWPNFKEHIPNKNLNSRLHIFSFLALSKIPYNFRK